MYNMWILQILSTFFILCITQLVLSDVTECENQFKGHYDMIGYKYSCKGKLHANDNPWTGVPIKLKVPTKDINQKIVIITVSATYDPPMERKLSDDAILNLATYSNSISNMWTYKHHEEAKNVRNYLYLSPLGSNDLDHISLRIVVSTRHNVQYNLSVELENIDIDLNKPQNSTLTLDSPAIYRFNYQNILDVALVAVGSKFPTRLV